MKHYSDEIDFISIVIPSYNRFHYLKECIESIHKYADTPFEIIIHDDNSNDGTREKTLSELKDKFSSIILNNGAQLGLGESINRCVRIAGSNFIIMLNADCTIEYPIFNDVINILKCPFVGSISLMTSTTDNILLENNGSKFRIIRGLGSGCAQAFRKDTFEKIGGWNSQNVASSNTDVSYMIRTIKNGYFIAAVESPKESPSKPPVRNLSMDREKNSDSTIARGLYDCSYPKLFNLHKSKYLKLFDISKSRYPLLDQRVGDEIYKSLSRKRYEDASNLMQISYKGEGGDTNIDYWHYFMQRLIKDDYSFNLEEAKKCGQDKWIDEIAKHKFKGDI